MKTSTKILLGGLGATLLLILSFLILIKSYINIEIDPGSKHLKRGLSESGIQTEQNREVAHFEAIDAKYGIKLHLKQDTFQQVKIVADENIIDEIQTTVEDCTLVISPTMQLKNIKHKDVYITFDTLNSIKISNGIKITCESLIVTGHLALNISNGCEANLNVSTDSLSVELMAGCAANIKGDANALSLKAFAGTAFTADYLKCGNIQVEAATASAINLGEAAKLDVKAGSGTVVNYKTGTKLGQVDISQNAKLVCN